MSARTRVPRIGDLSIRTKSIAICVLVSALLLANIVFSTVFQGRIRVENSRKDASAAQDSRVLEMNLILNRVVSGSGARDLLGDLESAFEQVHETLLNGGELASREGSTTLPPASGAFLESLRAISGTWSSYADETTEALRHLDERNAAFEEATHALAPIIAAATGLERLFVSIDEYEYEGQIEIVQDVRTRLERVRNDLYKLMALPDGDELKQTCLAIELGLEGIEEGLVALRDGSEELEIDANEEERATPLLADGIAAFETMAARVRELAEAKTALARVMRGLEGKLTLLQEGQGESLRIAESTVAGDLALLRIAQILLLSAAALATVGSGMIVLRGIVSPVERISRALERLSLGGISQEPLAVGNRDEVGLLGATCNAMLANFQAICANVRQIASGDFSISFAVQSEADELARALNDMTTALKRAGDEQVRRFKEQAQEKLALERRQAEAAAEVERERAASERQARAAERERAEVERRQIEQERLEATRLQRAADEILRVVHAAVDGDLTHDLSLRSEGTIGSIAEGLRGFFSDLQARIATIAGGSDSLMSSSGSLLEVSEQMMLVARNTSDQADSVLDFAGNVTQSVQVAASSTDKLLESVRDAQRRVEESVRYTSGAVQSARLANDKVKRLEASCTEIAATMGLITRIARQTNLLALNASVEAARAGEAGRGFSVVANEVKKLALETERSTKAILAVVDTLTHDTREAVGAISEIAGLIKSVDQVQGRIAGVVEDQTRTIQEITERVLSASGASAEIANSIDHLARGARETSSGANQTQDCAKELSAVGGRLREMVSFYTIAGDGPAAPLPAQGSPGEGRALASARGAAEEG